jgi:hypothetical protein
MDEQMNYNIYDVFLLGFFIALVFSIGFVSELYILRSHFKKSPQELKTLIKSEKKKVIIGNIGILILIIGYIKNIVNMLTLLIMLAFSFGITAAFLIRNRNPPT